MKKPKTVKRFARTSAADKRVAIAKDVLIQIKAGQFEVQRGTWAALIDSELDLTTVNKESLLGRTVVLPPLRCNCCAVGAAFLSSMRLFNVGQFDEVASQDYAFKQLGKYFSKEQLKMIENAFELGACLSGEDGPKEFGERYSNDTERAVAIFTNIVNNKGDFIP